MDALTHKAKCYAMNSFAYYFKDGIDDIFTYQNYISSGIADAVFIKRLEVNKEIKIKAQRKSLNILKTKYREWVDDLTNIIMDMTETYKFKKFDEMNPTTVMVNSVTRNPMPGTENLNMLSILVKTA